MLDNPNTVLLRPGFPRSIATRLALVHAKPTVCAPLDLGGCSAGSVDVVLFLLNALTRVEIGLEGGIDGENFAPILATALTSEGAARFRFSRVTHRYLRLHYSATGSPGGIAVLALTILGSCNPFR